MGMKDAKDGGGMPGFGSSSMESIESAPASRDMKSQDSMTMSAPSNGMMNETAGLFAASMGANDDAPVLKPKAPGSGMRLGKKKIGDTMGDMMGLEKVAAPEEAA